MKYEILGPLQINRLCLFVLSLISVYKLYRQCIMIYSRHLQDQNENFYQTSTISVNIVYVNIV